MQTPECCLVNGHSAIITAPPQPILRLLGFLIYPFTTSQLNTLLQMMLSCAALTFAERVPGCPIRDAIGKVVSTVPATVHPAMGI